MAAFEDYEFFLNTAPRKAAAVLREEPASPRRDALRAELERLHQELRHMRKTLDRRANWRDRLRRLVRRVVLRSAPARRVREGA